MSSAATNHRTKNEPDGSVTKWESYDGGKSWAMVEQTYPTRSRYWVFASGVLMTKAPKGWRIVNRDWWLPNLWRLNRADD